jgi:hypothetical protein
MVAMFNRKISIEKVNYGHTLIVVLSNLRFLIEAIKTTYVIFIDFFMSQSHLRPKFTRPPVVNIEHPLDTNIPFAPEWIKEYLSFIPLWITGITWLIIRFGKKAENDFIQSMADIRLMYKNAAVVYRKVQSTTIRPKPPKGNFHFRVIHITDPHLNCLPSLHVMVVTWAGYVLANRIQKLAKDQDVDSEIKYLLYHAKLITETTLYVKQHSVNCIPAALFVMKELFPGIESVYSESFLKSLFNTTKPVVNNLSDISNYMCELYQSFQTASQNSPNGFSDILIDFLLNYNS